MNLTLFVLKGDPLVNLTFVTVIGTYWNFQRLFLVPKEVATPNFRRIGEKGKKFFFRILHIFPFWIVTTFNCCRVTWPTYNDLLMHLYVAHGQVVCCLQVWWSYPFCSRKYSPFKIPKFWNFFAGLNLSANFSRTRRGSFLFFGIL